MLKIYGEALEMIREVVPIVEAIGRRDASLADQLRRAAQSVPLNFAEGACLRGRNCGLRFQTAQGSMRETLACIEVGAAFGYIGRPNATVLDRIDKIIATLHRLTR